MSSILKNDTRGAGPSCELKYFLELATDKLPHRDCLIVKIVSPQPHNTFPHKGKIFFERFIVYKRTN